jgi:hypothetical protein
VARDKRIAKRKGAGTPWVDAGENTPQGIKKAPPADAKPATDAGVPAAGTP